MEMFPMLYIESNGTNVFSLRILLGANTSQQSSCFLWGKDVAYRSTQRWKWPKYWCERVMIWKMNLYAWIKPPLSSAVTSTKCNCAIARTNLNLCSLWSKQQCIKKMRQSNEKQKEIVKSKSTENRVTWGWLWSLIYLLVEAIACFTESMMVTRQVSAKYQNKRMSYRSFVMAFCKKLSARRKGIQCFKQCSAAFSQWQQPFKVVRNGIFRKLHDLHFFDHCNWLRMIVGNDL